MQVQDISVVNDELRRLSSLDRIQKATLRNRGVCFKEQGCEYDQRYYDRTDPLSLICGACGVITKKVLIIGLLPNE